MGRRRSRSRSASFSSSGTSSSFASDDAGPSRTASTSKVTLGPALPPGFSAGSKAAGNNNGDSDDDDTYLIGPAPLPGGAEAESTAEPLGNGARAFLEREERRRKAQEDAEAEKTAAASSRPDWMLVPPTASSLATVLSDPKRALKSRGFQQNTRVQTRGSAPTGPADPESMAAWTETPEQRMQRLKDEVEGRRPKLHEEKINQDEILRADAQRRKDEEIARRIKEIDPSRSSSLLDLHRQKRAEEVAESSKDKRSDRERESHKSKSRDRHHDKDSSRSHRHPSGDREPSSSRHRSSRHRRDRDRSDEEDEARREHSEYERERRERKRRRSEKKRRLAEEEEAKKEAGPTGMSKTMLWDREKVLGVGARALDEKGKADAIRDAIGLKDRFAGGSSGRFL
ncbi:unnamed protein product [Tilletia laevis]|nr:unnamed protein product [Tilletia laevis]